MIFLAGMQEQLEWAGDFQVVGQLFPEFVTEVTNDVRKIGVVVGNDRKMRVAR